MSSGYTAESGPAIRPLFVAVNVYRSKSGWMASVALKEAGGRNPRTVRRLTTFHLGPGAHSLSEACSLAADVLRDYSAT